MATTLAGTSVAVAGSSEQLPLFYVSPGQINAQLPFNLAVGAVQLQVTMPTGSSNVASINVAAQAPKLFTLDFSGTGSAAATTATYNVLTPQLPAPPAGMIILWLNSMGATTGNPIAGEPAPGPPVGPLTVLATTTVTISGVNAPVSFAGLSPTMSGLYQVNVEAPFVSLTGPVPITVTVGGVSTQANVTIPYQQLGFYYSLLGGKPVSGQTLNAVSGSNSSLAFQQSDAVTWGLNGFNAWTDNTGLGSIYSSATGEALTLFNGSSIVYDNNGLENGTSGTFYDNTGGPANSQKPGLADLYSMSNYFPLIFAGSFQLSQPTTVTQLVGYFDALGNTTLPFDPSNAYVKYRMNIFSTAPGNLPTENASPFVGDVFTSDTAAGTFAYTDTGVKMISSVPTDDPKVIYRLSYTLNTPITLQPGQYWFSHDASVRANAATTSTSKSIGVDELKAYISSQKVEEKSYIINLFGREMYLKNSFSLPFAVQVRPSAPVAPR
jgi:uncharacterized protein (TIGR03437 family)